MKLDVRLLSKTTDDALIVMTYQVLRHGQPPRLFTDEGVPSQNGLFFDAPQRQTVTGDLAAPPKHCPRFAARLLGVMIPVASEPKTTTS
jgi:hypothetical protein